MNILVLEYFLSKGTPNNKRLSFYSEAINIFQAIINSCLKTENLKLYSWLNKSFNSTFENTDRAEININFSLPDFNNNKEYFSFLENLKIKNLDYFLIIAPETDNILYEMSKILEQKEIKNLGSSSKCIKKAANKWLLYQNFIESKIFLPETELVNNQLIRDNKIKQNIFPAVIKEFYGAGSELMVIDDYRSLKKLDLKENKNYLIQKIVQGTAGSLSVLANQERTEILTINKQIINRQDFKYQGGIVNYPFKSSKNLLKFQLKSKKNIQSLEVIMELILSVRIRNFIF